MQKSARITAERAASMAASVMTTSAKPMRTACRAVRSRKSPPAANWDAA